MPLRYFYSRPRVGGDYILQRCEMANAISTHAPAWGATESMSLGRKQRIISPHAPAWGATCPKRSAIPNCHISTHAPAWGATIGGISPNLSPIFLLTPPRGGRRPLGLWLFLGNPYFYSRPRVGGDMSDNRYTLEDIKISTHAPAWGATRENPGRIDAVKKISTHAPAWGATASQHDHGGGGDFYSRPRVGGDGNFSQAPGRCVIQIAEKYTAIQISCPFVHAIFEKLCR